MFEQVFVAGSGSICINIIKSLQAKGLNPVALLYKEHQMSPLSMFCQRKNIEHHTFDEKTPFSGFLNNITKNSLIISANNIFLFPKDVVAKPNLKIINFHNALLPAHRGMNAPTWTIFEQDQKAGITWHLVNKNIDDGAIIIQKSIDLDQSETALVLIRKLMNLAFDAYKEIEDNLLAWDFIPSPMPKSDFYQIHYAKDVPNGGFLDMKWDIAKISAFLRALDWGPVNQFAKAKIVIDNEIRIIEKYNIIDADHLKIQTNNGVLMLETPDSSRGGVELNFSNLWENLCAGFPFPFGGLAHA